MAKIDWREAKKYYMNNEAISYEKVATAFGVSHIAVRLRGSKEGWRNLRKRATEKYNEKLPDLVVESMVKRYIEYVKEND